MTTLKQKHVVFSGTRGGTFFKDKHRTSSILLLLLFPALIFGYQPLLQLGSVDGLHIDISLLYLIVLATVTVSLRFINNHRDELWQLIPFRLLFLYGLFQTVSLVWSQNIFRGIVTALFTWLLIGLVVAISMKLDTATVRHYRPVLTKSLWAAFVLVGLMALWQIFGDSLGVSPDLMLLPHQYDSHVFGFARPLGFSLEPQFFASVLLIPLGWFGSKVAKTSNVAENIGFVAAVALIILTLSRGGLLGMLVILLVLLITGRKRIASYTKLVLLAVLGALIGLGIIYSAAGLNTRDTVSGYDSVRSTVSQLTLDKVVLPSQPQTKPAASVPSKTAPAHHNAEYVASSTNSRLNMSERALAIWSKTPLTFLFGVGVGGFGATLHHQNPRFSIGSVVNDFYLETLAELGIVGFLLIVSCFLYTLFRLYRSKSWTIFAILSALLLQWLFFSGSANVIHIWVMLGLAFAAISLPNKKHLLQ